jgi:hypothetical protein
MGSTNVLKRECSNWDFVCAVLYCAVLCCAVLCYVKITQHSTARKYFEEAADKLLQ